MRFTMDFTGMRCCLLFLLFSSFLQSSLSSGGLSSIPFKVGRSVFQKTGPPHPFIRMYHYPFPFHKSTHKPALTSILGIFDKVSSTFGHLTTNKIQAAPDFKKTIVLNQVGYNLASLNGTKFGIGVTVRANKIYYPGSSGLYQNMIDAKFNTQSKCATFQFTIKTGGNFTASEKYMVVNPWGVARAKCGAGRTPGIEFLGHTTPDAVTFQLQGCEDYWKEIPQDRWMQFYNGLVLMEGTYLLIKHESTGVGDCTSNSTLSAMFEAVDHDHTPKMGYYSHTMQPGYQKLVRRQISLRSSPNLHLKTKYFLMAMRVRRSGVCGTPIISSFYTFFAGEDKCGGSDSAKDFAKAALDGVKANKHYIDVVSKGMMANRQQIIYNGKRTNFLTRNVGKLWTYAQSRATYQDVVNQDLKNTQRAFKKSMEQTTKGLANAIRSVAINLKIAINEVYEKEYMDIRFSKISSDINDLMAKKFHPIITFRVVEDVFVLTIHHMEVEEPGTFLGPQVDERMYAYCEEGILYHPAAVTFYSTTKRKVMYCNDFFLSQTDSVMCLTSPTYTPFQEKVGACPSFIMTSEGQKALTNTETTNYQYLAGYLNTIQCDGAIHKSMKSSTCETREVTFKGAFDERMERFYKAMDTYVNIPFTKTIRIKKLNLEKVKKLGEFASKSTRELQDAEHKGRKELQKFEGDTDRLKGNIDSSQALVVNAIKKMKEEINKMSNADPDTAIWVIILFVVGFTWQSAITVAVVILFRKINRVKGHIICCGWTGKSSDVFNVFEITFLAGALLAVLFTFMQSRIADKRYRHLAVTGHLSYSYRASKKILNQEAFVAVFGILLPSTMSVGMVKYSDHLLVLLVVFVTLFIGYNGDFWEYPKALVSGQVRKNDWRKVSTKSNLGIPDGSADENDLIASIVQTKVEIQVVTGSVIDPSFKWRHQHLGGSRVVIRIPPKTTIKVGDKIKGLEHKGDFYKTKSGTKYPIFEGIVMTPKSGSYSGGLPWLQVYAKSHFIQDLANLIYKSRSGAYINACDVLKTTKPMVTPGIDSPLIPDSDVMPFDLKEDPNSRSITIISNSNVTDDPLLVTNNDQQENVELHFDGVKLMEDVCLTFQPGTLLFGKEQAPVKYYFMEGEVLTVGDEIISSQNVTRQGETWGPVKYPHPCWSDNYHLATTREFQITRDGEQIGNGPMVTRELVETVRNTFSRSSSGRVFRLGAKTRMGSLIFTFICFISMFGGTESTQMTGTAHSHPGNVDRFYNTIHNGLDIQDCNDCQELQGFNSFKACVYFFCTTFMFLNMYVNYKVNKEEMQGMASRKSFLLFVAERFINEFHGFMKAKFEEDRRLRFTLGIEIAIFLPLAFLRVILSLCGKYKVACCLLITAMCFSFLGPVVEASPTTIATQVGGFDKEQVLNAVTDAPTTGSSKKMDSLLARMEGYMIGTMTWCFLAMLAILVLVAYGIKYQSKVSGVIRNLIQRTKKNGEGDITGFGARQIAKHDHTIKLRAKCGFGQSSSDIVRQTYTVTIAMMDKEDFDKFKADKSKTGEIHFRASVILIDIVPSFKGFKTEKSLKEKGSGMVTFKVMERKMVTQLISISDAVLIDECENVLMKLKTTDSFRRPAEMEEGHFEKLTRALKKSVTKDKPQNYSYRTRMGNVDSDEEPV